jgi:uncharacterized RDD family membrane protein YckC
MFCTNCGTSVAEGAAFCRMCGQPTNLAPAIASEALSPPSVISPGTPPIAVPPAALPGPPFAPVAQPPSAAYAGFWLRLVAHLIDGAVGSVVLGIIFLIPIAFLGMGFFRDLSRQVNRENPVLPLMFVFFLTISFAAIFVLGWLYYALMESSAYQGTLGKVALGLIVTDMQGRRISFGRASGRFFAKLLTGLIPFLIGYIMAGFTEKRQALHDIIASCLVLKKT